MSAAHSDSRILRGMEAQLRARQERLDAGEKPVGWKVGFGAPGAMTQLGLDAPLIGFLTDSVLLPSEAAVSVTGWTKPALEPEIAVSLGHDLAGATDHGTARAAIDALGPAIELADVSFAPGDVEAVLSGNIYNRHVIVGNSDPSRAGCVLDGLVGRVYRGGAEVAAVTDLQAWTGNIVDIVAHMASLLAIFGEELHAGEFIIMGSIVPPIWIDGSEEIRYTLDPVDSIAVTVNV